MPSRTACAASTPTGLTSTRRTGRTRHRPRGDPARAQRSRPPRQDPLHRQLDVRRPQRSSRPNGWPRTGSESRGQRAAALLDPCCARSSSRSCPPGAYGLAVIRWSPLAGGWLSGRYHPAPHASPGPTCSRPGSTSAWPANRRKRTRPAAAQLAEEAGLRLIHLAIAFALHHPAISRDHRAAHAGAPGVAIGRRQGDPLPGRRRPRPHRRHRCAGYHAQPRRQLLPEPGARTRGATATREYGLVAGVCGERALLRLPARHRLIDDDLRGVHRTALPTRSSAAATCGLFRWASSDSREAQRSTNASLRGSSVPWCSA